MSRLHSSFWEGTPSSSNGNLLDDGADQDEEDEWEREVKETLTSLTTVVVEEG